MHFFAPNVLCNSFFLAQVKIKSKISYLGKQISILHIQMTEQLSLEVDVKNVMYGRMDGHQGVINCHFVVLPKRGTFDFGRHIFDPKAMLFLKMCHNLEITIK